MAVYVDALFPTARSSTWRWPMACHMLADSIAELHEFAGRIGLMRQWFQRGSLPHYDLTPNKRQQAVRLGAIEIGREELVVKMREVRTARDDRMERRLGNAPE